MLFKAAAYQLMKCKVTIHNSYLQDNTALDNFGDIFVSTDNATDPKTLPQLSFVNVRVPTQHLFSQDENIKNLLSDSCHANVCKSQHGFKPNTCVSAFFSPYKDTNVAISVSRSANLLSTVME